MAVAAERGKAGVADVLKRPFRQPECLIGCGGCGGRRYLRGCGGAFVPGKGAVGGGGGQALLPQGFEAADGAVFIAVVPQRTGVGHAAFGAAGQEVAEWVVGGVAAGGGVEHQLFARAGEGYIIQAQQLAHVVVYDGVAVFFAQQGLVHQLVLIVAVQQCPVAALLVFAVPHKRTIHQRVFQPFGGMHGDDFDQCIVTFQPQLLCFALLLAGVADLVLQPLLQGGGCGAVGFGGGQELAQLPEVGEAALLAALQ